MTQPAHRGPYGSALERAAAVANLIQGEVLAIADTCAVVGDAAAPLSDEVAAQAEQSGMTTGLVAAGVAADEVVLLTQTCDLQVTNERECRCLVVPVRKVHPPFAREAARGRRPGYVALPWLDDRSVADLGLVTTVERSVLVGALSMARPRTPTERLHFADMVARSITRPALPNDINDVLAPFLKRIADRHDKNSAEGRCLERVMEFRLEATPDVDAPAPALTVLMIIEETDLPSGLPGAEIDDDRVDILKDAGIAASAQAVLDAATPMESREAWTALGELWIQPAVEMASAGSAVGSINVVALNGEELSYARSRNTPVLDLRYLSTRPTKQQPSLTGSPAVSS
jgi:hypothetical protein